MDNTLIITRTGGIDMAPLINYYKELLLQGRSPEEMAARVQEIRTMLNHPDLIPVLHREENCTELKQLVDILLSMRVY